MRDGVIALWIAGDGRGRPRGGADRRARLPGGASVSRPRASSPRGRCAATSPPPPDKSISHRAALIAAMNDEPVRVRNYLDAADTNSHAGRAAHASARSSRTRPDGIARAGRAACARARDARRPDRRRQRGHADAAAAGLARRAGRRRRGRSTATSRSAAARWTGSPSRWRMMGARDRGDATAASRRSRSTARACADRLRAARGQRPGQVVRAARRAAGRRRGRRWSSRARAATTPSACSPRAGVRVERGATRSPVANVDELELDEIEVPGDLSSAAFLIAAAVLVPGSRLVLARRRGQLDPHRLPPDRRSAWAR